MESQEYSCERMTACKENTQWDAKLDEVDHDKPEDVDGANQGIEAERRKGLAVSQSGGLKITTSKCFEYLMDFAIAMIL
ncbi:hypothetical protein NPIL_418601 [Nephila pilipes]|uniref:Uncharacterized protein n=1 Tax=Nephila pilipes TaxID=299642 RepID=A0A8X6MGJ7_NEPPI|nr:hypothetical protein NPIL_418601 [Nephila pilipes]